MKKKALAPEKPSRSLQIKQTPPHEASTAPKDPQPSSGPLTSKQRQFLKAQAHHLKALVQVGKEGLTETLILELEQTLDLHELVKLKLNQNAATDCKTLLQALIARIEGLVHLRTLGHTLLFFRPSRTHPTQFPLS